MYRKIMVAYDESQESASALNEAIALASALQAEMTIVSVLEPLPSFYELAAVVAPMVPQQLLDLRTAQLQERLEMAKQAASLRGVKASSMLRQGSEIHEILEAAKAYMPQLVVLGLHKHESWAMWAGTAHLVAQHLSCSVLAVQKTMQIRHDSQEER